MVALFLVLLAAGVAIALFLLRGGFSGTVSQGGWNLVLSGGPEPFSVDGSCSASRGNGSPPGNGEVEGTVVLSWQNVAVDDVCVLEAQYHDDAAPNSTDVLLQGFTAPTGITADLGTYCGSVIEPGQTADTGGNPADHIQVTLTYDGPGTVVFSPGSHGFEWVREADFDPLAC